MKIRPKVILEAFQWFKNGDHPDDNCQDGGEGAVVQYRNKPTEQVTGICIECGRTKHEHGLLDTAKGAVTICPGDWIITGVTGEHFACTTREVYELYDIVDEPGVIAE